MSLIKFNNRFPWGTSALTNFLSSDDFFNDDFFAKDSLMPAMNVKENDDKFEIELAAPGFTKDDFEVTLDNDGLHISAEKRKEDEEKEEGYLRKEFSYNSFEKKLQLPDSIKEEDLKAKYQDGVLRFNLIKKEEAKQHKPRKIEIA